MPAVHRRWHWEINDVVQGGNVLGIPDPKLLMLAPGVQINAASEEDYLRELLQVGTIAAAICLCTVGTVAAAIFPCPARPPLHCGDQTLGRCVGSWVAARPAIQARGNPNEYSRAGQGAPEGARQHAERGHCHVPPPLPNLAPHASLPCPQLVRLAHAMGRRFVLPFTPCEADWVGVLHLSPDAGADGDLVVDGTLKGLLPSQHDGFQVRAHCRGAWLSCGRGAWRRAWQAGMSAGAAGGDITLGQPSRVRWASLHTSRSRRGHCTTAPLPPVPTRTQRPLPTPAAGA